jgi:hypothetical protein
MFSRDLDPQLFGYIRARSLVVPVVFMASIPLALTSPARAKYLWLAVLVLDLALVGLYWRRPGAAAGPEAEAARPS